MAVYEDFQSYVLTLVRDHFKESGGGIYAMAVLENQKGRSSVDLRPYWTGGRHENEYEHLGRVLLPELIRKTKADRIAAVGTVLVPDTGDGKVQILFSDRSEPCPVMYAGPFHLSPTASAVLGEWQRGRAKMEDPLVKGVVETLKEPTGIWGRLLKAVKA